VLPQMCGRRELMELDARRGAAGAYVRLGARAAREAQRLTGIRDDPESDTTSGSHCDL